VFQGCQKFLGHETLGAALQTAETGGREFCRKVGMKDFDDFWWFLVGMDIR